MDLMILAGVLLPLLGTALGSGCVFFLKRALSIMVQKILTGFAAGVMVAASVWSLLLPALEDTQTLGRLSVLPVVAGFWLGMLFLLLLDHVIPHLHQNGGQTEGPVTGLRGDTKLLLAVTIHNIPEGMAVGVVYAGMLSGSGSVSLAGALSLSLGMAIQNVPEGAILSLPLAAHGMGKGRAFGGGVLSGAVEPAAALVTILSAGLVVPALPYFLSFAAGAMLYIVVEELVPDMAQGRHSNLGVLSFALGFTGMMVLDIVLG